MPADVQRIFNDMDGAMETKIKTKNVLNMIFQQAIEDGLIQRNPLLSKSIRITGTRQQARRALQRGANAFSGTAHRFD